MYRDKKIVRHPETRPLVRRAKDLAARRTPIAINLRAFSFGEGGTKCRKRTKTPILKTQLIQQGLQIIKIVLFHRKRSPLRLRAARPFCRSMPLAFPTFPPFCGGIAPFVDGFLRRVAPGCFDYANAPLNMTVIKKAHATIAFVMHNKSCSIKTQKVAQQKIKILFNQNAKSCSIKLTNIVQFDNMKVTEATNGDN